MLRFVCLPCVDKKKWKEIIIIMRSLACPSPGSALSLLLALRLQHPLKLRGASRLRDPSKWVMWQKILKGESSPTTFENVKADEVSFSSEHALC
jgi:hypothetical protein